MGKWHKMADNQTDLPKKDGFYECAIIRKDGVQRIYHKIWYRAKPKKEYYRDATGVTKVKKVETGWAFSGDIDKIVAWREKESENAVFS